MQTFDDATDENLAARNSTVSPEPAASPNTDSRRRTKKTSTAVASVVIALVIAGGAGFGMIAPGSKEDATVKTRTGTDPDGNDAETRAAIAMIQSDGASSSPATGVATTTSGVDPTPAAALTVDTVTPESYTATVPDRAQESSPPEQTSGEREPTLSRPNAQRSIYLGAGPDTKARVTDARAVPARYAAPARADALPVKPPFNTVLPVRTLGAILTVKSGGLARFEITREVSGEGWSLRKGTVVVGVVRSGEADRAYVSVIGFIDPTSNKLVKLGGDLLSADGGSGLKGKRRRVGSSWARALGTFARGAGRVANGVAQVAIGSKSAAATGRSPRVKKRTCPAGSVDSRNDRYSPRSRALDGP